MKEWLSKIISCPRCMKDLNIEKDKFICQAGCTYPIVDGIPIFILQDFDQTHESGVKNTLKIISEFKNSDSENIRLVNDLHPYVQKNIGGTSGNLYSPLIGKLKSYPIPRLRVKFAENTDSIFLDVGSNWGRWSVAAAKKGYKVIGIDPSIEGIFAAREVAKSLNVKAEFMVADARFLPFKKESIDMVFSYSVLQHFSKKNAKKSLSSFGEVLKERGECFIQMPNKYGIKSIFNQLKRALLKKENLATWYKHNFRIRYWTIKELMNTFSEKIGPSKSSVDGYFGLGIQISDLSILPLRYKLIVLTSEMLRKVSLKVPFIKNFADSIYIRSIKKSKV
tara:strand:- start:349 stop:1356 length:1008 start_codon:yes stop_codon:yes gene_type:complete